MEREEAREREKEREKEREREREKEREKEKRESVCTWAHLGREAKECTPVYLQKQ